MLVFGGGTNQTWQLSFSGTPTWSTVAVSGTLPPASVQHTTVYDPIHDQMILFGGSTAPFSGSARRDAWTLSLSGASTWSKLALGTVPAGRSGMPMVYDSARDRLLISGGQYQGIVTYYFAETWEYDLSGDAHWNLLASGIDRENMVGIYDPVRDQMVLFGGQHLIHQAPEEGHFNDVNILSLSGTPTWTNLTPRGASGRSRSSCGIYDPVRDRLLVFGATTTTPCGRYR